MRVDAWDTGYGGTHKTMVDSLWYSVKGQLEHMDGITKAQHKWWNRVQGGRPECTDELVEHRVWYRAGGISLYSRIMVNLQYDQVHFM